MRIAASVAPVAVTTLDSAGMMRATQRPKKACRPTLHARLLRPLQRALEYALEAAEHRGADSAHTLQHAITHVGDAALLLCLLLVASTAAGRAKVWRRLGISEN